MNLEEMKKSGVNKIQITDALMAPLLQLKVSVTGETTIPEEKNLEIYIDDNELDLTNRKTIIYPLKRRLETNETITIEPKFVGNKVKMNATIKRYTKEEPAKKEITVGSDLSGKTLILNFPTPLGTSGNYYPGLFSSEKYRVREHFEYDVHTIEIQNIETTEIIDILYQDDVINLESYQLPEDFGVVTKVIDPESQFAVPLTYIKYLGTNVVASIATEETLNYIPVVLRTGTNIITTNYQNATIDLVYPKNNELVRYFLTSPFSYHFNHEDKFLTLDDIYFKDCFTQLDDNLINALFNKLTIKCMNSINNNFSLDCDGNLVVNSITTKIKNENENALTFDKIYPIGSIYTSVVNTNPSTLFGGTWIRFSQGKVLVGVNESETEFNTVLKTGGSKNLQSHTHTGNTGDNGSHQHDIYSGYGDGGSYGQDALVFKQALSGRNYYKAATGGVAFLQFAGNHNHSFTTGSAGSGNSQNLQPYMTVYFWRRTA